MKNLNKKHFITIMVSILLISTIALPVTLLAADSPVDLLSTSSYAVLAGSAITNTGPTFISGEAGGNVGLYPGTSFTGQEQVSITNGTVHVNDEIAIQAKNDLTTVYNDAAGRTPEITIPAELGGRTLTPGYYTSETGAFLITGTLTLDSQGDPDAIFVFKTESTLTTHTDSVVNLINQARYCRIFWQIGSSATLGTTSMFAGHLFAFTSITLNTGAFVQGQILALNGAVTLDSNTIINGFCSAETTSEQTTAAETTAAETTAAETTAAETTAAETTAAQTAAAQTTESVTTVAITDDAATYKPEDTTSVTAPNTSGININGFVIGIVLLTGISVIVVYKSIKNK
ncbi:MAG: ice-binding family protein [Eubacteriales bacterium]